MDMTKELFKQNTHAIINVPLKVVEVNGVTLPLTWHVLACLNKIKNGKWDVTVIGQALPSPFNNVLDSN